MRISVSHLNILQVEEARREVMSRLSPAAQAFLVKRAAAKQRNVMPPQASQATTSGGWTATAVEQPTTAIHAAGAQQAGPAALSSNSSTAGKAQHASAVQRLVSAERHTTYSAERDTGANSNSTPDAGANIASRLRFSLEGQVVGLKAASENDSGPAADQQVVQRDILRYLILN